MAVAEVAEDGAVEVDEAQQPDPDAGGEDDRHGGELAALAVRDRGLDRLAGVAQDVPQEEHKDPSRERVEETLDELG